MSISPSFDVWPFALFLLYQKCCFSLCPSGKPSLTYEVLFILYLLKGTSPLARFFSREAGCYPFDSEGASMLMHRTPYCENVSNLCVFQLSGTGFYDYILFYNYPAMQHRTWTLLRVM